MSQRVLVVDDDSSTCELLQVILQGADMQALALTSSTQAAEVLRQERFDAIFVDVNMPPPNGIEITRQIRTSVHNQKTPVIMITGDDNPAVLAQGFQAGVNFFLYKPLVKDRILNLARVTQSVNQLERRRFYRVTVRRKVQVQCKEEVLEGETRDVSLNGLLVHAAPTFPLGSQVKIRLFLTADKEPIVAEGTVARLPDPDSMGIHLDRIGKNESKRLQEFLLPLILAVPRNETKPSRSA